ncbi:MAG: hypothetical protein P9M07_03110 [Candidatus Aceula meridiana]|nr:hypothetical protein [Candidatus Aceula meridiana]
MTKSFFVFVVTLVLIFSANFAFANPLAFDFERNRYQKDLNLENKTEALMRDSDPKLIKWIRENISAETQLPLSFDIQIEDKKEVYAEISETDSIDGIIERMIVEEGLVVYDGAVSQIVRTLLGTPQDLEAALLPLNMYWQGSVGELSNIRAGFPINQFVYDENNPDAVSSNLDNFGQRGFIFRIINANGKYNTQDPLDGKTHFSGFPTWPTVHWEDWKPVAGENAWVAMASVHLFHKKYFDKKSKKYFPPKGTIELCLAEELARAAIFLQTENGGIRMAPIGTYFKEGDDGKGWYNLISTENNLSWYAAFRMLYQVTQKETYLQALKKIEIYFQSVWNEELKCFDQGMHFVNGQWMPSQDHFATDVQTWGILALGCKKIDSWFGEGTSYQMWETVCKLAGAKDDFGEFLGVGFTAEHDRVSVEWTAGAICAARNIAKYYEISNPLWSDRALSDAQQMRDGIELLRQELPDKKAAYAYSSKRGWIPFGWFSHNPQVLSLASTAWVVLMDAGINPFELQKSFEKSKMLGVEFSQISEK